MTSIAALWHRPPEGGRKALLKKAGLSPRDILRTKEDVYKTLKLSAKDIDDEELITVMLAHPDLIQRPLVEKGDKVILARPAEQVRTLL